MPNEFGGYYFEELEIGQTIEFSKEISKEDVAMFAKASGDHNPIHLDEEYAKTTRFGGCIAHGILTAGVISAAVGTTMPGPGSIYVSQTLQFRRPVKVGATVTIKVTITALDEAKKFATMSTDALVDGKLVLTGEAVAMVPSKG